MAAKLKPTRELRTVLTWIQANADAKVKAGMARYGIPSTSAVGIPVGVMQKYAKSLGRNHELALALWETGGYEARMLAAFLDEPAKVTPAQMERWCKDFDSWAIVDTVCFKLFDQVPHAFNKVKPWCGKKGEFQKRAGYALLACLALHAKNADDGFFADCMPLIEAGASDARNFVKKGVSWALRGIAMRGPQMKSAARALAEKLAASEHAAPRWVGKDVLRQLK